jgi:hypothetical protein
MTKIITCSELRCRTAEELHALFRALQTDLIGTAPGSAERRIVLANLECVRSALAARAARPAGPRPTP